MVYLSVREIVSKTFSELIQILETHKGDVIVSGVGRNKKIIKKSSCGLSKFEVTKCINVDTNKSGYCFGIIEKNWGGDVKIGVYFFYNSDSKLEIDCLEMADLYPYLHPVLANKYHPKLDECINDYL